eukprot:scaffold8874_cov21-Tisochrysis_lutea.AAC.6
MTGQPSVQRHITDKCIKVAIIAVSEKAMLNVKKRQKKRQMKRQKKRKKKRQKNDDDRACMFAWTCTEK